MAGVSPWVLWTSCRHTVRGEEGPVSINAAWIYRMHSPYIPCSVTSGLTWSCSLAGCRVSPSCFCQTFCLSCKDHPDNFCELKTLYDNFRKWALLQFWGQGHTVTGQLSGSEGTHGCWGVCGAHLQAGISVCQKSSSVSCVLGQCLVFSSS